jgi:hypothetical protein
MGLGFDLPRANRLRSLRVGPCDGAPVGRLPLFRLAGALFESVFAEPIPCAQIAESQRFVARPTQRQPELSPVGVYHVFDDAHRSWLAAARARECGGVASFHDGSFGQPPTGRFFEINFRIASFQLPSIFKTSGAGPGGLRERA